MLWYFTYTITSRFEHQVTFPAVLDGTAVDSSSCSFHWAMH